jgi:DNA-nicking Smr family endonuclease
MARRKENEAGPKAGSAAKEKPFYRPFAALERQAEKKAKGGAQAAPEGKATAAKAPGGAAARPGQAAKPAAARPVVAPRAEAEAPAGPEPSFAELLYGVRPLANKEPSAPRAAKPAAPLPAAEAARDPSDEAVMAHLRGLVEGGAAERFEVSDDGRSIEGHRPEVDRTTLRRLRRGELPVDGRFDLHGLAAGAAREAVEGFVQRSRVRGDRVLLLVHGKGGHSPGGRGVLRGEIAAWLSQGEASRSVAAFATAAAEDGGEGALYVLLRRA